MSFVSLQQTSSESAKSAYTFIFGHIILQIFAQIFFWRIFDNIFEDFLMVEVGGGAGGYLEQGPASAHIMQQTAAII